MYAQESPKEKYTQDRRYNIMAEKGKFGQENIKAGDNARFLKHELEIHHLPPIDIDSNEEIQQRCEEYFEICMRNDMKPSVSGMAMALKISRFTLIDWKKGARRSGTGRAEIIEYYYNLLQALYEDNMQNGKMNPVSGIFLGKNHFGYADKQEVTVKTDTPFTNELTADEVKQKYLEDTKGLLPEAIQVDYIEDENSKK